VVLYELMTGSRPFTRGSQAETMTAIINDPHPPLSVESARLAEIVDKALDKDPKERYQSAADLAVDLRRLQGTTTTGSAALRTITPAAVPTRRRAWIWTAMLFVLATGGAIWFATRNSAPADFFANPVVTRLTDFPGDESGAEISPDGKFVVFVS